MTLSYEQCQRLPKNTWVVRAFSTKDEMEFWQSQDVFCHAFVEFKDPVDGHYVLLLPLPQEIIKNG